MGNSAVKNKSARVMGKKPPTFKDLKTATDAFNVTLRQITTSAKLSTKLTKLLKEYEVVVIKFDYSGFPHHIILRKACESLGLLCEYDRHASIKGHVILTTNVSELVQTITKETKQLCPNGKPPKIKLQKGGHAILSKEISQTLINHLEEEASEDEDSGEDSDEDKTIVSPKRPKKQMVKKKKAIAKKKTSSKNTKKKDVTDLTFPDEDDESGVVDDGEDSEGFIDDDEAEEEEEEYTEFSDDGEDEIEDFEDLDEDEAPLTATKPKMKKRISMKTKKGDKLITRLFEEDPSKDKADKKAMARLEKESDDKSKIINALRKQLKKQVPALDVNQTATKVISKKENASEMKKKISNQKNGVKKETVIKSEVVPISQTKPKRKGVSAM